MLDIQIRGCKLNLPCKIHLPFGSGHIKGPPESPKQASLPPLSYPAQNMSSVILYSGRNTVLFLHSAVDIIGTWTS